MLFSKFAVVTELRRRLNQAFLSSSHSGVGRRILKEFCPTPLILNFIPRQVFYTFLLYQSHYLLLFHSLDAHKYSIFLPFSDLLISKKALLIFVFHCLLISPRTEIVSFGILSVR